LEYKNYIKEYYQCIQNKTIIVSRKIEKLYKKLVDNIDSPKDNWIYNDELANKPIEFIEKFVKISKGSKAGQPVKLLLWELAFIQACFGFVDKDTLLRKHSQIFLMISRKNGKTFLIIGLLLFLLFEEMGAQIICGANTLSQAQKVIFEELYNIIKQSPEFSRRIKKRKEDLFYEDTLSTIKAVTNSPLTQDGLNASGALIDEGHAQKDRDLYDVIFQSMSGRDQAIIFMASTNGFVRSGLFDNLYDYGEKVIEGIFSDESFLGFYYELDDLKEVDDESCWQKCNPSIGELKKYSFIKNIYEQSKNDPSIKRTFLAKDMNCFMDGNSSTQRYLEFEYIKAAQKEFELLEFAGSYTCLGLDLSLSGDLTCLTKLLQHKGSDIIYLWQDFWLPDKAFEKHCKENPTYRIWFEKGWLKLCENTSQIKLEDIEQAVEDTMPIHKICPFDMGFDRYGSEYFVTYMTQKGYRLTKVGQGHVSLSNPMKVLRGMFMEGKVIFNNPITAWCLSNCLIYIDGKDNWKPTKLKNSMRIDGVSSMLDAMFVYEHRKQDFLNIIK